jgi:hypothetical protein
MPHAPVGAIKAELIINKINKNTIKGFSDFVHRLDSKELEDKNKTFRKLDLFPLWELPTLSHAPANLRVADVICYATAGQTRSHSNEANRIPTNPGNDG